MGRCCVSVVIYQRERKRVSKMVLNEVFELLKQIGAVHSESEFSRDWLVLIFKKDRKSTRLNSSH